MKRLLIHNPGWVTASIFAVSTLALCLVEGWEHWRESLMLFALLLTGAVISSGISATCQQERSKEYLKSIQQIALSSDQRYNYDCTLDAKSIRELASMWHEDRSESPSEEEDFDDGFDEPDSTQRRRP